MDLTSDVTHDTTYLAGIKRGVWSQSTFRPFAGANSFAAATSEAQACSGLPQC